MEVEERDQLEVDLRRRFDAGELRQVATLVVERYGPEIFGFLLAVMRVEDHAAEAFADFAADLWKDLPAFEWRCSMRTWAYTIARHRMIAFDQDPARRPQRNVRLSQTPEIEAMAERVRTTTLVYLRTDVKSGVAKLREQLAPDEQTLLILRIDRDLSWRDVAAIADVSEAVVRKRFERVKERLRALARAENLLP